MYKRIVILLLAIAVGACTSDKVNGPVGPLMGTFVLRSINGVTLPAPGNGAGSTAFEILADTLQLDDDGFGYEKLVLSSSLATGPEVQLRTLQVSNTGGGKFDVEYPCPDLAASASASCIGPPHHQGVLTSTGITFNTSKLYRTPMVFERTMTLLQNKSPR